jgi:hypothetical protein
VSRSRLKTREKKVHKGEKKRRNMKQKKNPLPKQAPSWLVYVLRPILFKSLYLFLSEEKKQKLKKKKTLSHPTHN